MDNTEIISCINCGKKGHISKKCIYPITSIGVIAINLKNIEINTLLKYIKKIQNNIKLYDYEVDDIKKLKVIIKHEYNNNSIQYLLIRRRSSLNYVEFVRGKYYLDDLDYLKNILNFITDEEKQKILNNDFNTIWRDFWADDIFNENLEYIDAKKKFETLKNGFIYKKFDISSFVNLEILVNGAAKIYKEPEWGFPKGRRNLKETNIECAKREFAEETNVDEKNYSIINISPFEETFLASNNNKYKHIYYIGQMKDEIIPIYDMTNKNQIIEISSIELCNFNIAFNKIREYDIERRFLLINLNNTLNNIIDIFLKETINII